MELLTGQPALTKDASSENDQVSEHRSVVQYVSVHLFFCYNRCILLLLIAICSFRLKTDGTNYWKLFE